MTAATETKKPAIKPEISELAERITKSMELDTTTNLVTPTTPVYQEAAEGAGLTQDLIGQVKKFETNFYAATTQAIGQIGIKAMEKSDDVNRVSGEVPMYEGDTFRVAIDRTMTGRNPRTGEATTTYGAIRTEFIQSTGANRGQMAKVRTGLREQAEAALNKGK